MAYKKHRELTKEEKFVIRERDRCIKNPIYFLEKYCKVLTEATTPQPFKLYDFQKTKCVMPFLKYDTVSIVKGRQTGVSTIIAGYALWRMIFIENFLTVILAIDQSTAQNLIEKIQLMIDEMPSWLRPKQTMKNKQSVGFRNGSKAIALSKGGKKGRSYSPKLLIFDEAAFIDGADELFTAASPGLAKTKGQFISISTPNGVGNWFYRSIHEAPQNGFHTEWIYWHEMPDRDEAWMKKELARLGPKNFGQEYDCDFLQSGNTVIDTEDILWQEKTNIKDPKETINIPDPDNAFGMLTKGKEVWIWENPVPGESYVISCDVARGDGADFSALSIWKLPTEEEIEKNLGPQQVCSFKGKIKTNDYGKLIDTLGRTYNNAIAVVENVGLGIATLNELVEREYPNLYYTDKAAKQVSFDEGLNIGAASKVPGFTTSAKSRPLVADATEAAWRSRQYIIRDKRYLTEAKTWIWKNGRAEHEEGCHDDLMMANGFFLYLYLTSIRQQGLAHDRYIGAINLVSKKREEKLNKMADLIKVSQIKRSSEWSLEYASGQNGEAVEAWNLTELIRR